MSDFNAHRSTSALRKRYGVAAEGSPALESPSPHTPARAGEILLTPGQKIALLTMRKSEWSQAVLAHLTAFGQADVAGGDYRACAKLGLAVHKGSYHVLTPQGRWRADRVAVEIARAHGLHCVTLDLNPRYGAAASAQCTCGWSTYRTTKILSYGAMLARDAHWHLQQVGVVP